MRKYLIFYVHVRVLFEIRQLGHGQMAKRTSLRDYFSVASSSQSTFPSGVQRENITEAMPVSAEETAEEANLSVELVLCHARLSGFNKEWQTSYPWVQVSADGEGMYCKLCWKHNHHSKKVPVGKPI